MTGPADRLLAVLEAAGVRLTPAEVAEAFWLALRVDLAAPANGVPVPPAGSPPPTGADPATTAVPETDPEPDGRVDLRLPRPEPPSGSPPPRPEPVPLGADRDTDPVTGWPMPARTVGALPRGTRVTRALRPLKRRVRTGRQVVLDEEATALRIAERRLWTPVWRPESNRWLHLTLVLDHSSVGGVWSRLGHEVRMLLERLGTFRTLRVAHLDLGPDGRIRLAGRARRSPARLADGFEDQLLLVLSDGVSGPWHDGEMARILGRWATRAPVAILQPLPQRLWPRTGLRPLPGRLSAPRPGAPPADYRFVSGLRRRGLPAGAVPVPILEIEPDWLRPWAGLVAGRAAGGIDATVMPALPTGPEPAAPPAGPVPGLAAVPTAERRVRDFRAGASGPAYRLARYLAAAAPLNLAVMRMVQAVMLPGSRPSDLAEVLYSGLLERVPVYGGTPDDQPFEFRAGVREVLEDTLQRAEAQRVFAEVSGFLDRNLARAGASFLAMGSAPVTDLTGRPALRRPIAEVRAEVWRRLGGTPGTEGDGTAWAPAGWPAENAGSLTVQHLGGPVGAGTPAPGEPVDLVVVAGGLAERATRKEYRTVYDRLELLREGLVPSSGRVVVVPGTTDVNRLLCESYFDDQAAEEAEPVPPYWPKWAPFAELTERLPGATAAFMPQQPWQLVPVPEARTVVAALNSTIAMSHRPEEQYAFLGSGQLEWFAARLREYERRGWLRLGLMHHDPASLRDAEEFARVLAPRLDVVLHGGPGGVREIGTSGVPAAGLDGTDRHQTVGIRPGSLRISSGGREVTHAYGDHWWPSVTTEPDPAGDPDEPIGAGRDDLVARVARAYRARVPEAVLTEHPWHPPAGGYLTARSPGRAAGIGVYDGVPAAEVVDGFPREVFLREGPGRDAVLVCRATPAADLRDRARGRGVRLSGLAEFQLGEDLTHHLEGRARFPAEWHVDALPDESRILDELAGELSGDGPRTIAVHGVAGSGKTTLLGRLAHRLYTAPEPVVPVMLDLRDTDPRDDLDLLLARGLTRDGFRRLDLDHGGHLRDAGRVVWLCDGVDHPAGREAYERLLHGKAGSAGKVVLASRNLELLAEASGTGPGRWVRLTGLDRSRVREFVEHEHGDRAGALLESLGRTGGLLELAANPRMLTLIAGRGRRLPVPGEGTAAIYQRLLESWLRAAVEGTGRAVTGDLWQALTSLACRLWESGETALDADAIARAADESGLPGFRWEPVQLLSLGTLLIGDDRHRYRFLHPSVQEWLVARRIAGRLDASGAPVGLLRREMSPLMTAFVAELAGPAAVAGWARAVLESPDAPEEARSAARLLTAYPGPS
ncbi:SAV_2336 N-terminal domain-related protein [Actinoplanes sp. NPDC051851]|uniref:SAV_2336 N-terminal domain-related protein n=1 Tax=Actinoplanes sp. NPDC051851 TaxID=3154753 RepID=UPI0034228731